MPECNSYFKYCEGCLHDKACIADSKILSFYEGNLPLSIAYNAFENANPLFLSSKAKENIELIICLKYFIHISEPTKVAEKLKFFKNDILSMILKANYYEYLEKQNANGGRNFFEIKQNHFVKYFSEEKKLEMIHSLVSEEEFKLASLFLLILSPKYSQRLTEIMPNDNETEKRLYLALEDDVFTLAKINPELYFRLLEILKDDSTGMLEILNEYREIANFSLASLERVKMIMDEYETVRDKIFPLQWFYTKLKNTSNEERIQIVRLLEQEEKISKADKDLLESFFSNHSRIFFL